MAECYRAGVTSVLATDADFKLGVRVTALSYSESHQSAHSRLIDALKRVVRVQAGLYVGR